MEKAQPTTEELFAFAHGICLALGAHGYTIHEPNAIMPIMTRMMAIVRKPDRNSLVAINDSVDVEEAKALRSLELALCVQYLEDAGISVTKLG
jgi:hypothetical protein